MKKARLEGNPAGPRSSWVMMILGFLGLGFMAHRRRNQTAFNAA
jgi:hypothetical protein